MTLERRLHSLLFCDVALCLCNRAELVLGSGKMMVVGAINGLITGRQTEWQVV